MIACGACGAVDPYVTPYGRCNECGDPFEPVDAPAGGARFTLSIELGNEAMSTPSDVAQVLERLAQRLDGCVWGDGMPERIPAPGSTLRDGNGNTVGSWVVES